MRIAALVGLTLLSSLMLSAQGASQAARSQGGTAPAAIVEVADAYVKASLAGDAKGIAALYTDDAVEMPPNQPMVKGRAAILAYYEKQFSGGMKMATFTLTHLESQATGASGHDVGTYQQSMSQPGATTPSTDSGKYIVLLRQTGGAWKVSYAIYNSDNPPAAGR